jgi:hypothetical protein
MKWLIPLLTASAALGACTSHPPESSINLGGYPPAFRAGYADGCNSARRPAGVVRDDARFKADTMYATGWRDGFEICGKKN